MQKWISSEWLSSIRRRERKDIMTKCVFIGESMNKNIKRKYLEMP